MANKLFVEMEYKQLTKTGQAACGDNVQLQSFPDENRSIAVLSDGLGSGVKASVLANMTTTMALRFLQSNTDLQRAVEVMMDALPVCSVRKISYATFSIADIRLGGLSHIIEMDSPNYIHLRGTEEVPPLKKELVVSKKWPDRKVYRYETHLEPEDRLIFCSDGVTQSGLGGAPPYRLGWRRSGLLEYVRGKIRQDPAISAKILAGGVATEALKISGGVCRDDISCLVVYLRTPRVMRLLTGPPYFKEHDREFASKAKLGFEHTVICGGTTANILERELGAKVELDMRDFRAGEDWIPLGVMKGIGIVTEGILTLSKVCQALESGNFSRLPTAARAVVDRLMEHDLIEFIVGTKVNEFHQDPTIPQDLELRRSVIRKISALLEQRYRKENTITFY